MLVDVSLPERIEPGELDAWLARGWFRMGQTIFTTNWLNFRDRFYSAIWLRVLLEEYAPDSSEKKIFSKNAKFQTQIRPVTLTIEKELLFIRYKQSVQFEASASIQALLFGTSQRNIYNTWEVNIFDDGKLIAVGFFDLGNNSAMGISSIYDPDYKKNSLGKYLIYLKIKFCRERGLKYFYPGYFVPGYDAFDYKLSIGAKHIEFLELQTDSWLRFSEFTNEKIPVEKSLNKLNVLRTQLQSVGVESEVLLYDYFYANQTPELSGAELFDYPAFLVTPSGRSKWILIVFDIRSDMYQLQKCYPVLTPPAPNIVPGYYSEYVLKFEEVVYATEDVAEMATMLAMKSHSPA